MRRTVEPARVPPRSRLPDAVSAGLPPAAESPARAAHRCPDRRWETENGRAFEGVFPGTKNPCAVQGTLRGTAKFKHLAVENYLPRIGRDVRRQRINC